MDDMSGDYFAEGKNAFDYSWNIAKHAEKVESDIEY